MNSGQSKTEQDVEPERSIPTVFGADKAFLPDYLDIRCAVLRDVRRSWRWHDGQPSRPKLGAAVCDAEPAVVVVPPFCEVAPFEPHGEQGTEKRLGVVYNTVLELDAQPQYGVAELVFTGDPEPTEYTISQLVPHVRNRRSSVGRLLDNETWRRDGVGAGHNVTIDLDRVACTVSLWHIDSRAAESWAGELWRIDPEGLANAKTQEDQHAEWWATRADERREETAGDDVMDG